MRVLIIAPFFYEQHRWMISAYKTALQLSKDMDIRVLTTGQPRHERLNDRLEIERMADIFLPDPVNYSIVPNLAWRLWRSIRAWKPDVVLINKHMFFTSLAAPLARLFGQKVVVGTDTFPGMNWFPRNPVVNVIMRIYAWVIGWPVLRSAHRVVLFLEDLEPLAKRLGLRSTVIHNGVDLAKLDQAEPPQEAHKAPGEVWIAYIGRMESIKGYQDILAVAEELTPQYPQVRFFMIGPYQGKEEWVAQHQTDRIRFLGHRHDAYAWLKVIDIFLLASYSEGLPNALMEAMAAGVACISSRVGGVKTLIKENERGLTFPAGNRKALKQQIIRLIENPNERDRLGQAGKEYIRSGFDWKVIRRQYAELFNELVHD